MSTSIGLRIRQLREQKGLSQGDIEESSGLLRCYVSRVENGHTVPSLETLERFAAALSVPVYRFFYMGEDPPSTPNLTPRSTLEQLVEEEGGDDASTRFLLRLKRYAEGIADKDREVRIIGSGFQNAGTAVPTGSTQKRLQENFEGT